MTEQELDRIMRRVLIDSLKMDDEKNEKDQDTSFEPTRKYKRKMRTMLSDPLNWLHRQEHPHWQRIARRVAIILITCAVAIGGIMAISPTARAAVIRWIVEWYENNIDYQFMGGQNTEALPQYEITELPDGYVETVRDTASGLVAVTYENQTGDVIYLNYAFMHQGTLSSFDMENADVFDIRVNHLDGKFFRSRTPENLNTLTWIDPDQNLQFIIDGHFEYDVLLHIADSISLCKTPK